MRVPVKTKELLNLFTYERKLKMVALSSTLVSGYITIKFISNLVLFFKSCDRLFLTNKDNKKGTLF